MRHKRLPNGVFDTEIHVLYGKRAELNAYFRRHAGVTDDQIAEGDRGYHSAWEPDDPRQDRRNYIAVVAGAVRNNRDRRCTLLHEIVHCALDVFDHKGVKYSGANDEALAYFVEWIYDQAEPVLFA